MAKKSQIPKTVEEYTVKCVFNEKELNITDIIKNCFETHLSSILIKS